MLFRTHLPSGVRRRHRDRRVPTLASSSAHVFRSGWRWIVDHSVARVRAKMAGQQPAEEPRPTSVPVCAQARKLQALQRPPGVGRGRASGTRCPPNSDFGGYAPLSRSSGSEFAGRPTARHVRNTRLAAPQGPARRSPPDPGGSPRDRHGLRGDPRGDQRTRRWEGGFSSRAALVDELDTYGTGDLTGSTFTSPDATPERGSPSSLRLPNYPDKRNAPTLSGPLPACPWDRGLPPGLGPRAASPPGTRLEGAAPLAYPSGALDRELHDLDHRVERCELLPARGPPVVRLRLAVHLRRCIVPPPSCR